MPKFKKIKVPKKGQEIQIDGEHIIVPNNPIIPFIEGDGVGPDIWKISKKVFDAAVEKAYKGEKKIFWMEMFAGEKSVKKYGKNQWLPQETIDAIKEFSVAIKGPLAAPIGNGNRNLNFLLLQKLDLFTCVRPVKYYSGAPSPMKRPQDLDIVIFRENTEDIYTGIEFKANTKGAKEIIEFINKTYKKKIREGSGIGIKPISQFGTIRLVKKAIKYALENKRTSVTLVHKDNIMKFTEGAFKDWGYKAAKKYFPNETITEDELQNKYKGKIPEGKVLIKDRIADSIFQQIMLKSTEYDVLAASNLNGDYIFNVCAAQIGGLGITPGANMSYHYGLFEAAHGSAPEYIGQDKVNPSSFILSGVMMLQYLGWKKAAGLIEKSLRKTIKSKIVTYDFALQIKGAKKVGCSRFGEEVIKNL